MALGHFLTALYFDDVVITLGDEASDNHGRGRAKKNGEQDDGDDGEVVGLDVAPHR